MSGPPPFLAFSRGLHDAAMLSLLGALFLPLLLPAALRPPMIRPLRMVAIASGLAALVFGIAWFLGEVAMVAGAQTLSGVFASIPAFLRFLGFGRILLVRLALICVATALAGASRAAVVPAVLAVVLQPWLGHPGEAGGGLALSEMLHLLAAGLWLGELVPLLLCLRNLAPAQAAVALRRFTWVGLGCVLVLAGTGPAQVVVLAGGASGVTGTAYGHVALAKAGLFVAALALAGFNGLRFTPRLARSAEAAGLLRTSVLAEALIGLGIVLLAGWLAMLAP